MKTKLVLVSGLFIALSLVIVATVFFRNREPAGVPPEAGPAGPVPQVRSPSEDAAETEEQAGAREPEAAEEAPEPTYIERRRGELSSDVYRDSMTAFQELVEHLRENPEEFEEILAAFKDDPALAGKIAQFADAVAHAPEGDPGRRLVLAAARDLLREEDDATIRNFALATLSKFSPGDEATVDVVARASREGSFEENHTAILALVGWLGDPDFGERATEELIQTAYAATDAELQAYAVGALVDGHSELPRPVRRAVEDYMRMNPPPEHRLSVASTLAAANDEFQSFAVEQMQAAYLETSNVELRRSTLTALALYGGREAVAWAREHVAHDSRLERDLEDYLEILDEGVADPNEILERKEERENERAVREASSGL